MQGLYTGSLHFYDTKPTKNSPRSYQISINCEYQSVLPLLYAYTRCIFHWPHLWVYTPAQCTRSRYMTPRLYLPLDLSIERRYMVNPPRHWVSACGLLLFFYVEITGLLSTSVFGLLIVRDRGLLFCRVS
jgi:hypothetical protein